MRHYRDCAITVARGLAALALVTCVALTGRTLARAQVGGGYDLSWSSLDAGGGLSAGASYTLAGTSGQPDAGQMAGGAYSLAGGFWAGGSLSVPQYLVYVPLVTR